MTDDRLFKTALHPGVGAIERRDWDRPFPEDAEGWAQAMLKLAGNRLKRDQLHAAAMDQAGRFDWKRSAKTLLHLYEEALASPKRQRVT